MLDHLSATEGFRAYDRGLNGKEAFISEVYDAVNNAQQLRDWYGEGLLRGFSAVNGDAHGVNLDFLRIREGFAEEDVKALAVGLLALQDTLRLLQKHTAELEQAAATSVERLSRDFGLQPVNDGAMWWAHPDDMPDPGDA